MKFISSLYDATAGISKVTVQHLGVKFTGLAHTHPDEIHPSEFAGCKYAEIRAEIAALKYERQLEKNKADMAIDFIKSCKNYKDFNENDPSVKVMYRQLNKRIKRVNDLADEINNLLNSLDKAIQNRDIVLKAIERKKNQKLNKDEDKNN